MGTASAPLMPSPTTATTATPVPTATAAGLRRLRILRISDDDERWIASRTSTSTAIPDEETQQYSVFTCDEQAATSQRKSRARSQTKFKVTICCGVVGDKKKYRVR